LKMLMHLFLLSIIIKRPSPSIVIPRILVISVFKRQEHHLVFFLGSLLIITEFIEIYIYMSRMKS
jgi:hypothetical protein